MKVKADSIERVWRAKLHIPKWGAWCFTGAVVSAALLFSGARWHSLQSAAVQLSAFNASPKFTTDAHGWITTWNEKMVAATGYDSAFMVGRQFWRICDPEWIERSGAHPVMDTLADPANFGRLVNVHPKIIKENGDVKYLWISILVQGEGPDKNATVTVGKKPVFDPVLKSAGAE